MIVARNGHPVARIVPWSPAPPRRTPGVWAGQVAYGDDIVGSDFDVVAACEESSASSLP